MSGDTIGKPASRLPCERAFTMPTLQLQLLGHFQLLVNGAPVLIHQARLQSLLAYLLLHRHSSQPRQHLSFVFWPNSSEAQARANLRKALYDLRRLLPDLDDYVQVDRHAARAQESATVWLDVSAFEEQLAQAAEAGQPPAVQAALEQAAALYQGELLPACYDEWVLRERERLHQRFLSSVEQLVRLLEERHETSAAAGYAQQLLQADPLRESTYRTLMRLHLQEGDRARALRVYHTCTTVLQQELGIAPGPEIQAAYQRLLNIESLPAAQPVTSAFPLVGRKREWAALESVCRSAFQGQPHVVWIAGEAGIGKSRLAEELLQWAGRQGYAALQTHAYAAEGQLPYAPVADWLRSAAIRTQLVRLERVWLNEVARLLPELLVERPDLAPPQPLADGWQRQRFREALVRAFVREDQPLLIVLDDLQWCDRDTLEWLHYLLRFDPQAALLLVGTVRLEEVAADHPLWMLATSLRREGKLLELELDPLDAAETAALAALVSGHELDADQSALLYAETKGNPLFVVETMRAQGAGVQAGLPAPLSPTPVPPKVQAVIGARLAQLTPATRELAELAAVVGHAFTAELLAQAGESSEDALVRGLDELWQRRILRQQGIHGYDFIHDKLREVTYAGISPARRRWLHRRVAQALALVYADQLDTASGQIAEQYRQAGLPRAAVVYYERAAAVAQRVHAHAEAAAYLAKALALLAQLPVTPDLLEQELRLQLSLGPSLEVLHGISSAEASQVYARSQELAEQVGDDLQRLMALDGLWRSRLTQGQVRPALAIAQQSLALAERMADPARLLEARARLGDVLYHLGQWRSSRMYLEQTLDLEEDPWHVAPHLRPAQHPRVMSRRHLALVLWHLGYPAQALAHMRASYAQAQTLADPHTLVAAWLWTAWLHRLRQEVDLTQTAAAAGLALAQAQGFPYWEASCRLHAGWALVQQGQFAAGVAHIEAARSLQQAANFPARDPDILLLLAEIYGRIGQPGQGLLLIEDALAEVEATGARYAEAELYRLKGELLQMQRVDEQTVESCFVHALAVARQQEAKALELRAAISLGRLWQRHQKRRQAHDLLADVYAWFGEGFDTRDLKEAAALLDELA